MSETGNLHLIAGHLFFWGKTFKSYLQVWSKSLPPYRDTKRHEALLQFSLYCSQVTIVLHDSTGLPHKLKLLNYRLPPGSPQDKQNILWVLRKQRFWRSSVWFGAVAARQLWLLLLGLQGGVERRLPLAEWQNILASQSAVNHLLATRQEWG